MFVLLTGLLLNKLLFNKSSSNEGAEGSSQNSPHQFSLEDANSQWVIVNKDKPLSPKNYSPASLTIPAVPIRSNITDDEKQIVELASMGLNSLVSSASQQGISLDLQSGYRSYNFQKRLYDSYASQASKNAIDSYSASPGYSEHQTGLAVDLGGLSNPACNVKPCFTNTPESNWLADNSHKYGFIIRYPADKQKITGYEYEPWHLRYVGIYLATSMKSKNISTLEEYFQL